MREAAGGGRFERGRGQRVTEVGFVEADHPQPGGRRVGTQPAEGQLVRGGKQDKGFGYESGMGQRERDGRVGGLTGLGTRREVSAGDEVQALTVRHVRDCSEPTPPPSTGIVAGVEHEEVPGDGVVLRPAGWEHDRLMWTVVGTTAFDAGPEALEALSGLAFRQGVPRLQALIPADRPDAQRVALAAGYRWEARRRDRLTAWVRLPTDPPGPAPRFLPDLPDGRLTDGVVVLSRLGPRDTDGVAALRALPEVAATSFGDTDTARVCAEAEYDWLTGRAARMVVHDADSGALAGEIGLFDLEPPTGQGMIGYDLAREYRGRGYATRAVRLLAGWAFDAVGLARLVAGTEPGNLASQKVLQRAGFRREGYQRARLPGPDGTRIDDILWALLPTDRASW